MSERGKRGRPPRSPIRDGETKKERRARHNREATRRKREQQSHEQRSIVRIRDRAQKEAARHSMTDSEIFRNVFNSHMASFKMKTCEICLKTWPTRGPISCCKKEPHLFSPMNDMYPFVGSDKTPLRDSEGRLIQEPLFQDVSCVEEMLVARALPIMRVYMFHGSVKFQGNVINIPQDLQKFVSSLPRLTEDLPIILTVRKQIKEGDHIVRHKDFRVRRQKIHKMISFLKENNEMYSDIVISQENLDRLPDDDYVPLNLKFMESDKNELNGEEEFKESFLPIDEGVPELASLPMSESTHGLASMCFPARFPRGSGDPTLLSNRIFDVKLPESFKHLLKIRVWNSVQKKFKYPFVESRFVNWAENIVKRKRALAQASFFLKRNPSMETMDLGELKKIARDPVQRLSLMNRMSVYGANVTGSNSYWYLRQQELIQTFNSKGAGTIFLTLSFADYHWYDLHKLLGTAGDTIEKRIEAVRDNPHICVWFFVRIVEKFVDVWLGNLLKSEWKWYRFEFQHRNSIHVHGTAKLSNDPGLLELVALLYAKVKGNDRSAAKEYEKIITSYIDPLVSAMNPDPNFEVSPNDDVLDCRTPPPDPHPCSLPPDESDFVEIFKAVQRHHCVSTYCIREKSGEYKCRFNFPKPLHTESRVHFEEQEDAVRVTFLSKRNDPRSSLYNPDQLKTWRANVDIEVILNEESCIKYMAKYTTKPEPRSRSVKELFQKIFMADENQTVKSLIKSLMIRSLGERDIGMQETCHSLLQEKLHHSDFQYKVIWLDSVRITESENASDDLVNQYAKRQDMPEVSLDDYVKQKLGDKTIARWLPSLRFDPEDKNFWQTAKNVLVRFFPWVGSPLRILGPDSDDSPETWIKIYHDFMSDKSLSSIDNFASDPDRLRRIRENLEEEYRERFGAEAEISEEQPEEEEWIQISKFSKSLDEDPESNEPVFTNLYSAKDFADDLETFKEHLDEIETFFDEEEHEEQIEPEDVVRNDIYSDSEWNEFLRPITGTDEHSEEEFAIHVKYQEGNSRNLFEQLSSKFPEEVLMMSMRPGDCKMCRTSSCGIHEFKLRDVLDISQDEIQLFVERFQKIKYILIENVYYLDIQMLNDLNESLQHLTGIDTKRFGGICTFLVTPLNEDQFAAVNEILKPGVKIQLLLGAAGTGKTFVIKTLKRLLGDECMVTATTGCAAVNLGNFATTMHTAFSLPIDLVNSRSLQNPSPELLKKLQRNVKNKKLIIIDEFSMLGKRTMSALDQRLKQSTGNTKDFLEV
eukprot:TRINITY_DN390_c0_g1_i3.p1 TRINITY_DN390_c0_g1~~TRINITY_DN390_c0_g1_i3.p1  ORF type:complete len:1263 (+),score=286.93 TRINITY_DN390_c0_g1_i3:1057-4845(+)